MIKTWIADVRPLLEKGRYNQYYSTLPSWRKEKADKIRDPLIRAQSVGVWELWSQMKNHFNLEDLDTHNFSHSGNYVLCAAEITRISHVKLGCDIEKMKDIDDNLDRLAKRFFSYSEYQAVFNCETQRGKRETFFRLWALKESYLKATGAGMTIDTRSVEVKLGEKITLLKQPVKYGDSYSLWELNAFDLPYKVAVCTTDVEVDRVLKLQVL